RTAGTSAAAPRASTRSVETGWRLGSWRIERARADTKSGTTAASGRRTQSARSSDDAPTLGNGPPSDLLRDLGGPLPLRCPSTALGDRFPADAAAGAEAPPGSRRVAPGDRAAATVQRDVRGLPADRCGRCARLSARSARGPGARRLDR